MDKVFAKLISRAPMHISKVKKCAQSRWREAVRNTSEVSLERIHVT